MTNVKCQIETIPRLLAYTIMTALLIFAVAYQSYLSVMDPWCCESSNGLYYPRDFYSISGGSKVLSPRELFSSHNASLHRLQLQCIHRIPPIPSLVSLSTTKCGEMTHELMDWQDCYYHPPVCLHTLSPSKLPCAHHSVAHHVLSWRYSTFLAKYRDTTWKITYLLAKGYRLLGIELRCWH